MQNFAPIGTVNDVKTLRDRGRLRASASSPRNLQVRPAAAAARSLAARARRGVLRSRRSPPRRAIAPTSNTPIERQVGKVRMALVHLSGALCVCGWQPTTTTPCHNCTIFTFHCSDCTLHMHEHVTHAPASVICRLAALWQLLLNENSLFQVSVFLFYFKATYRFTDAR
jgi:hypothetical protein